MQVWILRMLLTKTLIRSEWSPECHHAHRCCVSVDVETASFGRRLYKQSDYRNVTIPTGVVYRWMLKQLHSVEDNINKVITGMSPYPQVLCIGGCWWQLHPAEDNINKVIIGISPWPMDVAEFDDGGRCVRSQIWAWASSQWGTNNITNGKQRDVGVTITTEKEEWLQVTWEL